MSSCDEVVRRGVLGRGVVFFFNDTATTEIYTLSLHDALPISNLENSSVYVRNCTVHTGVLSPSSRSEEHTSELQSRLHLVCRLLLEKKKTTATLPRRGPHPRRRVRARDHHHRHPRRHVAHAPR